MDEQILVSISRLGAVIGIGDRQIQTLAKEGIIPKAARGKYDLEKCAKGYIEWLKNKSIAGGRDGPIDYHAEKARHVKLQADLAELTLVKEQGLVTTVAQVEKMVTKAFAEVRAGMRNLPGRCVSLLIGETDERRFKRVMLEEIDAVLETMANADLTGIEDDADEGDGE